MTLEDIRFGKVQDQQKWDRLYCNELERIIKDSGLDGAVKQKYSGKIGKLIIDQRGGIKIAFCPYTQGNRLSKKTCGHIPMLGNSDKMIKWLQSEYVAVKIQDSNLMDQFNQINEITWGTL